MGEEKNSERKERKENKQTNHVHSHFCPRLVSHVISVCCNDPVSNLNEAGTPTHSWLTMTTNGQCDRTHRLTEHLNLRNDITTTCAVHFGGQISYSQLNYIYTGCCIIITVTPQPEANNCNYLLSLPQYENHFNVNAKFIKIHFLNNTDNIRIT